MTCRWQCAAEAVAADQNFEREAAEQLRRPGGLPSAAAAAGLVARLLQRARLSGGVAISMDLLRRAVLQCTEQGQCLCIA
jgi:hypothetical protein